MDTFLLVIIIANVLISYKGFKDLSFFRKFEFHVGDIISGERYRMISSGFLHVDLMHLLFNMLTLYFFAPVVMHYLGISFIIIYFVSLYFGNVLSLYFNKYNYNYRAVGASGAVTGIVYSAILLQPFQNLYLFYFLPIPAIVFGIGYLFYSIYWMKKQNDNIGHAAHIGGAIGGFLLTLLSEPSLIINQPIVVLLLTSPIVVLFIMHKKGKL